MTRSRPPRQPRRRQQLRRLQGQIRSAGPKRSRSHLLRALTPLSPPPGGGGWEASPSPPPPHRAQKDELARGEKGRGLRLSWVGTQWARWPATSSGAEPAVRGAGRVAPRALSVHSPCCGAGAGRNAEGSGVGRGQATSSPSSEGRGK